MALSTSSRSPPRGPCKSASDQQSATPIRNPVRSSLSAEAHHRPSYATISFARPAACFSTVASSGRHNPVVEKTAARHTAHIALTQKSPLLWRIVTNWTGAVRKRLVSRNHVAPCSDIIDNGRLNLHFRQARVIFRANRDHVSMIGHPRTRISSWITLHTYHAHTLISKVLSLSGRDLLPVLRSLQLVCRVVRHSVVTNRRIPQVVYGTVDCLDRFPGSHIAEGR